METLMRFLIALLLLVIPARAGVIRLKVEGKDASGNFVGEGTCFPVGKTSTGKTLVVTAKHNLRGGQRITVWKDGVWQPVTSVFSSQKYDVASFEINAEDAGYPLTDPVIGSVVTAFGFGPEYNGRESCGFIARVANSTNLIGKDGYHAIPGDSGGPAMHGNRCIGLIVSYGRLTAKRSDNAELNLATQIVPSQNIVEHLCQYYRKGSCGPSGCPVWTLVDPRVVSPPPVKEDCPTDSVSPQLIEKFVQEWLNANAERIKGRDGADGKDGIDGISTVTTQPLEVILSREGKVVDREIIQPGQPLILDVGILESNK
jgi:hypothetical protein